MVAVLTSKNPISWLSYGRVPGDEGQPTPAPAGYQRMGLLITGQTGNSIRAGIQILAIEAESGVEGPGGVFNAFDKRYFTRPGQAHTALVQLAGTLHASRELVPAGTPVGWYCPPIRRRGDDPKEHEKAIAEVKLAGVFDACDVVFVDAHPHGGMILPWWKELLGGMVSVLRSYTDKPLVPVILDQFATGGSEPGRAAGDFVPEAEICEMHAHALSLKVATVARMGGYRFGPGPFTRLPYGSNPAEAAINRTLGVVTKGTK